LSFIFVLLAMFVFMYLLLIRPQRQQQRRHAEMVESLKVGDEIITVGGMYGDVTEVHPDRVTLEIAEDVEVEVAKRAVASVVPPEEHEALEAEPVDVSEPPAAVETAAEPEPAPGAKLAEEDAARR
jgi:preprotein translocase subunit YajC